MHQATQRAPSWQLFQSQIHTELNQLIDSKIQNHEVLALFHQIEREAQAIIQNPAEALERARQIVALAMEGVDLEQSDISRDNQRADQLRIRQSHVTQFRRVSKDWRPADGR